VAETCYKIFKTARKSVWRKYLKVFPKKSEVLYSYNIKLRVYLYPTNIPHFSQPLTIPFPLGTALF